MSCPDWGSLIDERRRRGANDPRGWDSAVAHLDSCDPCRRQAERLDPILAFRRLPKVTVSGDESEEMRRRVAALRRARQVERDSEPRRRRWPAAAAAAVLVAALMGASYGPGTGLGDAQVGAGGGRDFLSPSLLGELANLPVLEHLDQPFEQVVQWSNDELSMILLVDERLDV